jgi:hypothetical protein
MATIRRYALQNITANRCHTSKLRAHQQLLSGHAEEAMQSFPVQ